MQHRKEVESSVSAISTSLPHLVEQLHAPLEAEWKPIKEALNAARETKRDKMQLYPHKFVFIDIEFCRLRMTTELHEITITDVYGDHILDAYIDWTVSTQARRESTVGQDSIWSTLLEFKSPHALRHEDVVLDIMRKRFSGTPTGKPVMTIQEFATKLQKLVDMNTVFVEWSATGACDLQILSKTLILFGFDSIVNPDNGLSAITTWRRAIPTCLTWRLEVIFPVTHPKSLLVGRNHHSPDDNSMQYKMVLLRMGLDDLPSERNVDHFWSPEERPNGVGAVPNNCKILITSSDLQQDPHSNQSLLKARNKASRLSKLSIDALIEPSFLQVANVPADFLPNWLSSEEGNQGRNPDHEGEGIRINDKSQEICPDERIRASAKRQRGIEGIIPDREDQGMRVAGECQGIGPDEQLLSPRKSQTTRTGTDSDEPLQTSKKQQQANQKTAEEAKKYLCECGAKIKNRPWNISRHLQMSLHKKLLKVKTAGEAKKYLLCECGAKIRNITYSIRVHRQKTLHKKRLKRKTDEAKEYLCECGKKVKNQPQNIRVHLQSNRHKKLLKLPEEDRILLEMRNTGHTFPSISAAILEKTGKSVQPSTLQARNHSRILNCPALPKFGLKLG